MGARGVARVVTVVVACTLACAASAGATDIGANDDTGKFAPDAGAGFYREMASIGMRETVITVRWLPSDPLGLGERPLLDLTVAAARSAGLSVVFATYPYPPREVAGGVARPEAFGAWLAELARQYPDVREFVVGNEPNQPAFWRPQFSRSAQLSARTFGPFLAAGYDALKDVDPTLTVVGVGLSPRGNDRPFARSNVSTSPVRFLQSLGAWYRASGRDTPLMDGLSFHPYPNKATDPLSRGYPWPNAGFVNLNRIKQAIWDAFTGTPQPTTVDGLSLYLDEVGWQVDTSDRDGYSGDENVAVTDEETQALVYGALVRSATCDPDVAAVNLFGFQDDALRTGFQAGLFRADGTARPALAAVRDAIASAGCAGGAGAQWRPSRSVLGATRPRVRLARAAVVVDLAAAEGASARVCLLSGAHTLSSARRALSSRRTPAAACAAGRLDANRRTTLRLGRAAGARTLAVRLSAEANPARSSTLVRVLAGCLTPNRCSGSLRTDVRSHSAGPDPSAHRRSAAGLGPLRR
jgi:hypothetical protein